MSIFFRRPAGKVESQPAPVPNSQTREEAVPVVENKDRESLRQRAPFLRGFQKERALQRIEDQRRRRER